MNNLVNIFKVMYTIAKEIIMEENTHIKQSKEWIEFNNYYMSYNIFDQLDFFRLEDIHTNI